MAEFIAVVNDTDPKNGGKSYALKITGNNHAQMLGKRIGDVVASSTTKGTGDLIRWKDASVRRANPLGNPIIREQPRFTPLLAVADDDRILVAEPKQDQWTLILIQ